jgi:hypothetical protein
LDLRTFLFGLRTRYPSFGFTHPLSFLWVYAPIILHLGLRTRYLSFGFTHPLSSFGFMHPLSSIWVYAPAIYPLGLRTHYPSFGFMHPLSSIWVYAPAILPFGFINPLFFLGLHTCFLGLAHLPFFPLGYFVLGLRTCHSSFWVY